MTTIVKVSCQNLANFSYVNKFIFQQEIIIQLFDSKTY